MCCESDCVLQLSLCGSHWNCYIKADIWMNVRICTTHCAFSSKLLEVRLPGDLLSFSVEFACVEVLCALELLQQSDLGHVLRCFCVLQLSRCRSQWDCSMTCFACFRIWTKLCVFSSKRVSLRRKLSRLRDGVRHRRIRVKSFSNGFGIGSEASRWLSFFLCWSCATWCIGTAAWKRLVLKSCFAMLLCFTAQSSQVAVELWNCFTSELRFEY